MRQKLSLIAVVVRDYDEAIAFYTAVVGFRLVEDTPQDDGKRWVVVAPPGADGQTARVGDQTGGRVFLFLETDDFSRDHAAMTAAGVRFIEAPRHEPYGTVAVFEDLYGNRWDLIEPKT